MGKFYSWEKAMSERQNYPEKVATLATNDKIEKKSDSELLSPVIETQERSSEQKIQTLWQQISKKFSIIDNHKIDELISLLKDKESSQVLIFLTKAFDEIQKLDLSLSDQQEKAYLKLEKSIHDLWKQFEIKKEQENINQMLKSFEIKYPLMNTLQFRQWIGEFVDKDPFLISAFLTDFLREEKGKFAYSEEGEIWPLGQKERYGDWKFFSSEIQKLSSISNSNEFQQKFAKCFDLWRKAFLEHARGFQNDMRVAKKYQQFIKTFLHNFPVYNSQQLEEETKQKRAEQGTLTFEVFLDDIAKKPELFKGENLTFSDLYAQREQGKIEELGKANMNIKTFEKVLELSGTNNKALKEAAEAEVKKLWNKGLTKEQIANEVERIYNESLEPAVKGYGMLNREEVIKTAFVGLKPQDYKQWGLFFQKIQVIGKYYYGYDKIAIDGKWWPQTQAVLLSLRGNPKFQEYRELIDLVFRSNKSYGEKAQKLSQKLVENQIPGLFDQLSSFQKKTNTENFSRNADSQEHISSFGKSHANKHLDQSLKELSDEDIDISIPRNNYLEAIKKFLSVQNLPDELKFDAWLAEKILDNTWKGELFEEIQQLRKNSQTRAELLQQQRAMMQELIVNQAGVSAINVGTLLFQNFGIHVTFSTMKKNQSGQDYFECFDGKNPNLTYTFNPSTWNLGLQTIGWLDQQSKKISLNPDKEDFLAKIPTYYDLINQAVDVNSYLPQQRLNTEEELNDVLVHGLQDKINYQVGEIEWATIAQNIEKKQKKDRILSLAKKLLSLDEKKELSLQEHKAFYEMLVPLLNTLEKANPQELIELQNFLQSIENYINQNALSPGGASQKELDDNPILMVLAKKEIQKLLQEKGNIHHKSEFALGILFQMLEKNPEGSNWSLENKLLDVDKIAFLNHTTGKTELEKNKQYWSRYRKTVNMIKLNYNKIAESQDKLQCESDCKLIEQQIWDMVMVN